VGVTKKRAISKRIRSGGLGHIKSPVWLFHVSPLVLCDEDQYSGPVLGISLLAVKNLARKRDCNNAIALYHSHRDNID
jgi:hypothetical protein